MRTQHSRHETAVTIAFIGLLCLVFAVSKAALTGPFLFDDFPNLANLSLLDGNPTLQSLGQLAAQYGVQPGRPLSMLSFAINDAAWPSDPWAFKYTNLLLHLLVGVTLFGFARSIASARMPRQTSDGVALLTTAAWLLHPMQLATSMLVVQRMTQLEALFAFAGLWGYVVLLRRGRAFAALAALGSGTLLATLCKETGALVPLLALVTNATVLRPILEAQPARARQLVRWGLAIPIALLAAAIAWLWPAAEFGARDFTLGERLLSECRVLSDYIFHILVPSFGGDGIYHDDFVASRGLLQPISTLPALFFVAGAITLAYTLRRKRPFLAFSLLWFFAGHLLESSVFPLELYFEHRNYLPMAGLLFGVAVWITSGNSFRHRITVNAAILWIAIAAWMTSVQAPIWGSSGQLATIWALEHPNSPRATQQHALYLIDAGKPQFAANNLLSAYARGIRGSDFPLQALVVACKTNDTQIAAAASPLVEQALRTGEYNNSILEAIRKLRRATQGDTCQSIVTSEDWLSMTDVLLTNPSYAGGSASAYIHIERSYLRTHQRNLDLTMQELEMAWKESPTPELARMAAATLASAGLYDQALLWAKRSRTSNAGGLQGWLSGDHAQAASLETALERARDAAVRNGKTGSSPEAGE